MIILWQSTIYHWKSVKQWNITCCQTLLVRYCSKQCSSFINCVHTKKRGKQHLTRLHRSTILHIMNFQFSEAIVSSWVWANITTHNGRLVASCPHPQLGLIGQITPKYIKDKKIYFVLRSILHCILAWFLSKVSSIGQIVVVWIFWNIRPCSWPFQSLCNFL